MKYAFTSTARAKRVAKSIHALLTTSSLSDRLDDDPTLSRCKELTARLYGYADWHELERGIGMAPPTPDDDQVDRSVAAARRSAFISTLRQEMPSLALFAPAIVDAVGPSSNRIDRAKRGNVDTSGAPVRGTLTLIDSPDVDLAFCIQTSSQAWIVAVHAGRLMVQDALNALKGRPAGERLLVMTSILEGIEAGSVPQYPIGSWVLKRLGYSAHGHGQGWLRDETADDDDMARSRLAALREKLEATCHREALAVLTDNDISAQAGHYEFYAAPGIVGDRRRAFARTYPWAASLVVSTAAFEDQQVSLIDLSNEPDKGMERWLRQEVGGHRDFPGLVANRLAHYQWRLGLRPDVVLRLLGNLPPHMVPDHQDDADAFCRFCRLLSFTTSKQDDRSGYILRLIVRERAQSWQDLVDRISTRAVACYDRLGGIGMRDAATTNEEKATQVLGRLPHVLGDLHHSLLTSALATRSNLYRWIDGTRDSRHIHLTELKPRTEELLPAWLVLSDAGIGDVVERIEAWWTSFPGWESKEWRSFAERPVDEQMDKWRPVLARRFREMTPVQLADAILDRLDDTDDAFTDPVPAEIELALERAESPYRPHTFY